MKTIVAKSALLTLMAAVTLLPSQARVQEAAKPPAESPRSMPRAPLAANTDSRRFLFTLDELDHGRKLNGRTFEVLCREDRESALKAGSRIPVPQGGPGNFQYLDIGLNVRAQYQLRADGRLDLRTEVEMSNIALPENAPKLDVPVLRQTRSEINATVTPDRPTILDTIEDLNSGHTYQLTITVKSQ